MKNAIFSDSEWNVLNVPNWDLRMNKSLHFDSTFHLLKQTKNEKNSILQYFPSLFYIKYIHLSTFVSVVWLFPTKPYHFCQIKI